MPGWSAIPRRTSCRWSPVGDVIDPETGEVYLDAGEPFTKEAVDQDRDVARSKEVVGAGAAEATRSSCNSLKDDGTESHEAALLKIYQRLRPGNPPQLEKAKELFKEKFHDPNRYRLGQVGRFRINRKFDQNVPETRDDAAGGRLRQRDPVPAQPARPAKGHVDDIDHLGNRRLRTIDELAADELRKGFLKLRRTVQERMSIRDQQDMTPRSLINPEEHLGGDRVLLRPRRTVAGRRPDQPAGAADARAPAVGPRAGRPEPQAGRLRGARRAHLALRPHLPDRDAGRHEHRPDLVACRSTPRSTSTAS